MEAAASTVTHALPLRLIDGSGVALKLTAELRYDASDPYAVDAMFQTGEPRGVRWVFARELLSEGIFRHSGEGDVQVWPFVDSHGRATVLIELRSPDGQAQLQAPADRLSAFLQSTYAIVPRGAESSHIDLDAMVSTLLGETDTTA